MHLGCLSLDTFELRGHCKGPSCHCSWKTNTPTDTHTHTVTFLVSMFCHYSHVFGNYLSDLADAAFRLLKR